MMTPVCLYICEYIHACILIQRKMHTCVGEEEEMREWRERESEGGKYGYLTKYA